MKYVNGRKIKTLQDRIATLTTAVIVLVNSAAISLPFIFTPKAIAASTVVTPTSLNGWSEANVREDGASVINTVVPDNKGGQGSLEQSFSVGAGKTDFKKSHDYGPVDELSSLSFDWYRHSSSTATTHFTPAVGVYISDGAGNVWLLKWEGVYNGYPTNAPVDTWIEENLLNAKFWRIPQYIGGAWVGFAGCNQPGDPYECFVFDRQLDDSWLDGFNVAGIEVGIGSGWSGSYKSYVDNVTVNGTTYDFEPPHPDPTGKNQLNIGGTVYRDVALGDCHNKSSCENRAEVLKDWEMRLYAENGASWDLLQTKNSDIDGEFKFNTLYEAGVYHVCEVLKAGWTQQTQTWSGSGYLVNTPNLSGDSSEGSKCNTVNYDDTADRSSKSNFGNVDTKKPFTEVISPDEHGYYNNDSNLVINIRSSDQESGVALVVANLHKSSGHLANCANQVVNPAVSEHNFTCTINLSDLDDGEYFIKANARDAGGNLSNTVVWYFSVDSTKPSVPNITHPVNEQYFNNKPISNQWTASTDSGSGVKEYQIAYNYDDGHSFGSSTCPGLNIPGYSGFIGCRHLNATSRNHNPSDSEQGGVTILVRALDNAGNYSDWSSPVHYFYDSIPPAMPVHESPANDNLQNFNDFYFEWSDVDGAVEYEYQSATSPTVDGNNSLTTGVWNNKLHGGPDRNYLTASSIHSYGATGTWWWQVRAIDAAGNKSPWTDPWKMTIDLTKPDINLVSPSSNAVVQGGSLTQEWSSTASDVKHYLYESWHDDSLTSMRWSETLTTTSKTASNVEDATFWWRVKSVDHAGNESDWSPLWKLTVDNTAPDAPAAVLSADSSGDNIPNDGHTNSQYFTFTLDSSDDTTRYQLKYWNDIPGSGFKEASPWNQADLSGYSPSLGTYKDNFTQGEGVHYFAFSACDAAGNCSAFGSPFIVTYDVTAPVLTINALSPSLQTKPTITGTTTDPSSVVKLKINGITYDVMPELDGSWSFVVFDALPAPGVFVITATSTDAAGNASVEASSTYNLEEEDDGFDGLGGNPNPDNPDSPPTPLTDPNSEFFAALTSSTGVEETDAENTEVLSTETENTADMAADPSEDTDSEGKILGLKWFWWLPIVLGAFLLLFLLARRKSDKDEI